MKPNLDRRGRLVRGVSGLCFLAAAITFLLIGWPSDSGYRWLTVCAAGVLGLFQLFEAKKSWCIVRACGLKTPL